MTSGEGAVPPVLAEVWRGPAIESVHRGAVVAVDAAGAVVASCGDPALRSFARSFIKPLQALPPVADGGLERFGLTAAELAVICGSHSGELFQVEAVLSILKKIDVPEAALQYGGHMPFHGPTADAMRFRAETPRPVDDNCSGKHAGMLALARLHGWDPYATRTLTIRCNGGSRRRWRPPQAAQPPSPLPRWTAAACPPITSPSWNWRPLSPGSPSRPRCLSPGRPPLRLSPPP